MKCMTKPKRRY